MIAPFHVELEKKTRATYTLRSASFLHAPGFIQWCITVNKTDPERAQEILRAAYEKLPDSIAFGLLNGKIPFEISADTVVISHDY